MMVPGPGFDLLLSCPEALWLDLHNINTWMIIVIMTVKLQSQY